MRKCMVIRLVAVVSLAVLGPVSRSALADDPVTNVYVGPVTNNATLNWLWTTQYSFRVESPVHGSVSGTSNDWYDVGTEIDVEATPDPHYLFSEWHNVQGGTSTSNLLIFPLAAPYTNVVAVFTAKVYTVTVNSQFGTPAPGSTGVSAFQHSQQSISPEHVGIAPGTRVRLSGYSAQGGSGQHERSVATSVRMLKR